MQKNKDFDLRNIKAVAIDMDGVLWRGNTPLPGLEKLFSFLRRRAIPFMLATNNASKTPNQYEQRLANFGVTIKRENVLSSSLATAAYLQGKLKTIATLRALGLRNRRLAAQGVDPLPGLASNREPLSGLHSRALVGDPRTIGHVGDLYVRLLLRVPGSLGRAAEGAR